jgi:protein-disulfide isomerase
MNRKTLFIGASLLLVVGFVIAALVYNTERVDPTAEAVKRNPAVLTRFHSPTLGSAEAKVHIVEFLDPACETCAAFYPFVKRIMAANPGRIRLSIRYAPFHRGSEDVVKALEAARRQGRYWEALEAVMNSQSQWVANHTAQLSLVWQPLARAGVNVDQAQKDMHAAEIAQLIQADVEDGRLLNVTKTPEFFVNGRTMPTFGYDELQKLVREELATAYR